MLYVLLYVVVIAIVCAHVSFKSDQLKVFRMRECREVDDPERERANKRQRRENRACKISLVGVWRVLT